MSTVVVVKKNGKAAIAADSLIVQGNTLCRAHYKAGFDKIHRFGESYIGITGSSTHHDVFESLLENHADSISFNSRREVFQTYLKLHKYLKEEFYLLTQEDDKEQPYESSQITALIANPYGLFEMYSYREVTEYSRFWAIGSGSDYALGAMYSLYDGMPDAEGIARAALTAAAEFDDATALPMSLYTVRLAQRDGRP
jgi:ATP-dependent protease HslVU (ClpYQ) peptidase subunit